MSRSPSKVQRIIAFACQRIWPSEWAMNILHTNPDSRQWRWNKDHPHA